MHAEIIRDYLSEFDVKIVVYIRRQDEYLESVYSQAVKMGAKVPVNIMEFYKNSQPSYNYFQVLKPWSEVFGRQNIKVNIYHGGSSFNVIESFFQTINENCPFDHALKERSNLSWHPHLVRLMAKYRDIFSSPAQRNEFATRILSQERFGVKGRLLNAWQRKTVLEHYAESNKKVARQYFNRESLFDISNIDTLNQQFVPVMESEKIEKVIFSELLSGSLNI